MPPAPALPDAALPGIGSLELLQPTDSARALTNNRTLHAKCLVIVLG
jgi:hypothetical protein